MVHPKDIRKIEKYLLCETQQRKVFLSPFFYRNPKHIKLYLMGFIWVDIDRH
jgi:hypothetical protein